MTRLRSNGNLRFNKSYRDDCIRDDELADAVYLRSGDKEKAFGVITNRRANYYTLGVGKCIADEDIPAPPEDSPLRTYNMVTPKSGSNRLRLRNMGTIFQEFKIKYYSPYDQVNSIKEETRWGSQLTLEFPDMDTLDIVLFEVFRMGENFKSMQTDTSDSDDIMRRESKKDYEDEVKVYPNPNDGKFVIYIENPNGVNSIRILDNLGKEVHFISQILHENQYEKKNLRSGVYIVEVIFESKIIRKKIVVN